MNTAAKLIIVDPWEAYEIIEGIVLWGPFRFIAKDGRKFHLHPYPFLDEFIKWWIKGDISVMVIDGQTGRWIGRAGLRRIG